MFEPNKKRYLTKGVDREVPFDVQLFCQKAVTKKKEGNQELDYLQIFEFNVDKERGAAEVIHRQEQPFFIDYHQMKLTKETLQIFKVRKIWVIDDGIYQTMLLPEEY